MPEIDDLMQVFQHNITKDIGNESNGDTLTYQKSEIPLETLTQALCGVIGIPVHGQDLEGK